MKNDNERTRVPADARATRLWFGAPLPSVLVDPRAQVTTMGWDSSLPPLSSSVPPLPPLPGAAEPEPDAEVLPAEEMPTVELAELDPVDEPVPPPSPGLETEQLEALPRPRWLPWAAAGALVLCGLGVLAGVIALRRTPGSSPAAPVPAAAALSAVTTGPSAVTTRPSAVTTRPSAVTTRPSAVTTGPSAVTTRPSAVAPTPATLPADPATDEQAQKLAALERQVKTLAARLSPGKRPARSGAPRAKSALRVHYDRKNNVVDVWLPPDRTAAPTVQVKHRSVRQVQDPE